MRLNKKQLLHIERYLDFKELIQIDLRTEVLDHIALNIETALNNDNVTFKDAFNSAIKIWDAELESSSSFWLGWYWVGPKLLMNKCVKEVKKMYFWSIFLTCVFLCFLFLLNKVVRVEVLSNEINIGLGVTYLLIFMFTVIGFFKMKVSGVETTFRYLYKLNAIGFCFMYLAFNPLFSNGLRNALFNGDTMFTTLLHSILLIFGFNFLTLYNKHFSTKKLVLP